MKAQELRIGNWVSFGTNTDRHFQITSQGINDCDIANIAESPYQYEPIPLTEKWLIDFGLLKNDIGIWNNGDAIYFDYGKEKSTKIHNVHQLQNLYFALTGEELQL